ncbi:MAG: flagellar biosynthesis anti-sigma factor FlgM [Candidatus Saccharimonadales bacterium]
MQIYGPTQLHGAQPINSPHLRNQPVESAGAGPASQDVVQISDAGRLTDLANGLPAVRQDRVDAIRAQLSKGTYETADKLNVAVNRMLDELA